MQAGHGIRLHAGALSLAFVLHFFGGFSMSQSSVSAHEPGVHPKWRADIDGLRAIAVSSVVLFHAFPRQLEGGYVGVDIFFVISGFLISSILFGSLKKGTFSFADFYARRVRRIFPALIVVLLSCFVFGWHALLADEYRQFGKELAGGAGFVSNLVLWSGAGYFDSAAELKPLLHLWSLGIEEQFYMVWPLVLWLAWMRRTSLLVVTLLLGLVSFLFNLYLIREDMVATFYSPLTRFWELLAGAALAYLTLIKKASGQPTSGVTLPYQLRSTAGIALILAGIFLLNKDSAFPGYWALLPVVGAVLLISAGEHAWFNRYVLSHKAMVWIGLISYPLYLWHWPLLAYPRIIEAGDPNWMVRAAAVVLSVILAWLTYKFIETPVRTSVMPRKYTVGLATVMVAVAAAGVATWCLDGIQQRPLARITADISGAREDNHSREPGFKDGTLDLGEVRFRGQLDESVLFLGDSLMAHYFSRVEALYGDKKHLPVYSATFAARPGCRPIPGGKGINSVGKQCDRYYDSVMQLAAEPVYKRIVISASWQTVFSEDVYRKVGAEYLADLLRLKQQGKEIYLISMAPYSPTLDPTQLVKDIRQAHLVGEARMLQGDHWLMRDEIEFLQRPQGQRMQAFAESLGATIVDPFDTLCPDRKCIYVRNGIPLYRDALHIRASVTRTEAKFIDPLLSVTSGPLVETAAD